MLPTFNVEFGGGRVRPHTIDDAQADHLGAGSLLVTHMT